MAIQKRTAGADSMSWQVICLTTAVLLSLGSGVVSAEASDEGRFEIGIQGGFFQPDRTLSGKPQTPDELEPEFGLRTGYRFAEHWNWFFDVLAADFNTNTAANDAEVFTARTGIEAWFGKRWFIGLGGGWADYRLESATDFDRTFGSLGFGQRFRLDRRATLCWELRGDQTFGADDGLGGDELLTGHFLIGVTWKLGLSPLDSDGDGVPDGKDACPGTPTGVVVDARGCPIDSDGDGVWDGLDRCPNTPRDWPVDAHGCPLDTDGDGVPDGADECPGTPRGARVDEVGCPIDSDRDGVYDGLDRCPDTPYGARVDERGCPIDSDGDGVPDGFDQCPGTPPGTEVNAVGCPRAAPLFVQERMTLVLEGVFFELNSAALAPDSRDVLDRVAASLRDWPEVNVEIGGHTDSTGTDGYNLTLSKARAESVRNLLVDQGVDASRLTSNGYGESQPIASNATRPGRATNRRVELTRKP